MKWVLRVLPLACAGFLRAAEPTPLVPAREALPPILVAAPVRVPIDPLRAFTNVPRIAASPISERTRSLLYERGLAVVKAAQTSEAPAQRALPSSLLEPDPVMMDRFVVTAQKDTRIEPLPPPDSPFLEVVKTGRFFTSRDGSKTGDFKFVPLAEFTRFEIGFSLRF